MAFNNAFTAVVGATYTAAQYNTHVRDNFTAVWVYTTAGDIVYATSATALARLGKPASLGFLINDNAGIPSWFTGGSALNILRKNSVNGAFEWASQTQLCVVKNSIDFSHTSGAISWDTDEIDVDGWHTTTSRITVPLTGVYAVGAALRHFESGGGASLYNYIGIKKNGTSIDPAGQSFLLLRDGNSKTMFTPFYPISASANDYFEAEADINGGRTVIATHSRFWVVRLN